MYDPDPPPPAEPMHPLGLLLAAAVGGLLWTLIVAGVFALAGR